MTCYWLPGSKSSIESAHRLDFQLQTSQLLCKPIADIGLIITMAILRRAPLQPSKGLSPLFREVLVRLRHPEEAFVMQQS